MKSFVAAIALAAGVSASYPASNVTYTTEIVTSYETYCPGPTTISYGTNTYTITEATTFTITDCPCTVSKPVYPTSSAYPTETPVYPTEVPTTYYPTANGTISTSVAPTGGVTVTPTTYPTTAPTTAPTAIPTAGAAKVGAGLVGLVGVVAALL